MLFETFLKLLMAAASESGEEDWDVHVIMETDAEGENLKAVVEVHDDNGDTVVMGTFAEVVAKLVDIIAD